jgi:hypothetical protein
MVAFVDDTVASHGLRLHIQREQEQGAERRLFPRKEIHATVEGKRIDHTLPALRAPHVTLALRDLSLGGLSAISPMPLERGERLTVSFPPVRLAEGQVRGGWDACGRVVRCDANALGYRVAVEFDALPAAA